MIPTAGASRRRQPREQQGTLAPRIALEQVAAPRAGRVVPALPSRSRPAPPPAPAASPPGRTSSAAPRSPESPAPAPPRPPAASPRGRRAAVVRPRAVAESLPALIRRPRHEPPKLSRRPMAEHRFGPEGKGRRHPPPLHRQRAVPDRVDPTMDDVQTATASPTVDHLRRHPEAQQLPPCHQPVLSSGECRDRPVELPAGTWRRLTTCEVAECAARLPRRRRCPGCARVVRGSCPFSHAERKKGAPARRYRL